MSNTEQQKDQLSVSDFRAIKVTVASPEEILEWSHGEVLKPETINYRTQKPELGGLFCEKIFGPTKDWECYCGKYKKIRYKGVVCDKCGVEVTRSSVRRVRVGHIDLSVPVAHIWYSKGSSSVVSALLNISAGDVEKIVYFASFVISDVNEDLRQKCLADLEKEYKEFKKEPQEGISMEDVDSAYKTAKSELNDLYKGKAISELVYREINIKYGQVIRVGIGAEAILNLLKNLDIDAEIIKSLELSKKQIGLVRTKTLKRARILQNMKRAGVDPTWLVLTRLPVLPPDLRPMVQLDGGRFAASDLNDLYRRVINRNNRLKRLLSQGAPEVICRNEKRMLQEAVDALIDNSIRKGKVAQSAGGKRKLKSLSDMLRGKQGRFRQNLLGKRVDYSGRSVIVVGPRLKLHQCGLPKVMALELFKPFVIGRLIADGYVHNVKNATRLIERGESFVWDILEDVITDKLVLLNRAPTLHRLGIQAFQPVLIEGKAIQIHPLVTSAFNADFDGDQMAVHLPLSDSAQKEAHEIMLSSKNLLKPASGDPVLNTSFDIVLGINFMTVLYAGAKGENRTFASENDVISAYDQGIIAVNAKIKVRLNTGEIIETSAGRLLFNEIMPEGVEYQNGDFTKKSISKLVDRVYRTFGVDATAKFVDDLKDLGFIYAQKAGYTFAVDDIHVPAKKESLLKDADEVIRVINQQFAKGLITEEERYTKTIETWMDCQTKIEKEMVDEYPHDNDLFIIMDSGARGKVSQMTQVAGMKGLVADPTGAIIELPIRSNFKEGLTVFEYFESTHGSRKGRADTALRTSEAGYLTRRLVDVSQDVVVTTEDCGTSETRKISKKFYTDLGETWDKYIKGRVLGKEIAGVAVGTLIMDEEIAKINGSNVDEIQIFSLIGCRAKRGICQKCYGIDLATGRIIEKGSAAGIVAAQAIGEPGTQLTMRTFHTGGAAGEDITSGLPRVQEIFEARVPKRPAILAEIVGIVSTRKDHDNVIVTINGTGERADSFEIPEEYHLNVEDGKMVAVNEPIAENQDGKTIRTKFAGTISIDGKVVAIKTSGNIEREYIVPRQVVLKVKTGDSVIIGQALTEGHYDLNESLKLCGANDTQNYIIKQVQTIYESQGQDINDKHIEVIVRQMYSKVRIVNPGDSLFMPGQVLNRLEVGIVNDELKAAGKKQVKTEGLIMGITRVALKTESFLSAASFQETTSVLIDAALSGKVDHLRGLKENVIIGKLIPAGTGYNPEADE